ncbi:MAG: hypothetical protein WC915_06670, partial [archaeon]
MKKRVVITISIILTLFFLNFVFAESISEDLHLNIQTTFSNGTISAGTFNFVFNISKLSDCSNVVYTNSTTLTTDSRGIISYYLPNVNLNFSEQYYLCYYRNGTLKDATKIVRSPYSFMAKNVTLSGVEVDSNFSLGIYNLTANYYFGNGTYLTDINDTLSQLNCGNGQVVKWNSVSSGWYCADDNLGSNTTGDISSVLTNSSIYLLGGSESGEISLTFNETRLNATIDNKILTNNQSIVNWITSAFVSITSLADRVGNWSLDKPNYYTKTDINNFNVSYLNTTNETYQLWAYNQTIPANAYTDIQNTSVTNYINSNNQSVTNAINDVASAGEPLWTANYTAFNTTWSNTYNSTTNVSITNSITANNQSVTNSITANNNSVNSYIASNNNSIVSYVGIQNGSIVNWATATFTSVSDIINKVGNWSADKSSYYTKTDINNFNTSYLNTTNATYNTWAYNQTIPANAYTDIQNTSMKNYVDSTFVNQSDMGDLNVNNSEYLNGYNASYFMPLNTSVYGNFDFNGGFVSGDGVSIIGGDIYAQIGYFYNISSLSITNLNINGSLFPYEGYDNQFDLGSSDLRWKDAYIGGTLYVNGVNISKNNESVTNYINSNNQSVTNAINYALSESKWTANYSNMTGDACSPNFVTGIYENGTFMCGTVESASETDPYWNANYTAFNVSWSNTYNSTTNTSITNSITANNQSVTNAINANNNSVNSYIASNNNSIVSYVGIQNGSIVNWATA